MRHCTFVAFTLFLTFQLHAQEASLVYPETKIVDQVDNFHGTDVADPYRWLEEDVRESKDVADWVAAQNKVTFAYLKGIPGRDAVEKRITELWNYEKISAPFKDCLLYTSDAADE